MDILSVLRGLPPERLERSVRRVDHQVFIREWVLTGIGKEFAKARGDTRVNKKKVRQELLALCEEGTYYLTDPHGAPWIGRVLKVKTRPHPDELPSSHGKLLPCTEHLLEHDPVIASHDWLRVNQRRWRITVSHPERHLLVDVSHHAFREYRKDADRYPGRHTIHEDPKSLRAYALEFYRLFARSTPARRTNATWINEGHGRKATYRLNGNWVFVMSEREDVVITVYWKEDWNCVFHPIIPDETDEPSQMAM